MTDNPVRFLPATSMPMPSARSASHALLRAVVPMLAVALAACSMTPPPPSAPPAPVVTPAQRLAAVDAAADADATELDVQPLRDPEVDDLRAAAAKARAAGAFPTAADALDHALKLSPEDPGLWQERAEVAVVSPTLTTPRTNCTVLAWLLVTLVRWVRTLFRKENTFNFKPTRQRKKYDRL